jgi:hypothetical protein
VRKVPKVRHHQQDQQVLKVPKVDKDFSEPKVREDQVDLQEQQEPKVHKVEHLRRDQQELKELKVDKDFSEPKEQQE